MGYVKKKHYSKNHYIVHPNIKKFRRITKKFCQIPKISKIQKYLKKLSLNHQNFQTSLLITTILKTFRKFKNFQKKIHQNFKNSSKFIKLFTESPNFQTSVLMLMLIIKKETRILKKIIFNNQK